MRFRLHNQNANSGQVNQNKTAIAALSSRVDALQVDVGTTQVTGDDPVYTVGEVDINSSLAPIAFADAFSNGGISHALDSSLFSLM